MPSLTMVLLVLWWCSFELQEIISFPILVAKILPVVSALGEVTGKTHLVEEVQKQLPYPLHSFDCL